MAGDQGPSLTRARFIHISLGLGILALAFVVASLFPVRHTETAPFATPAFQRVWNSEIVSAARPIDLWGSEPLAWRVEAYIGAPNNRRTVQYFERGRMEVESGSSEVTLGLLARELTFGRIDLGSGISVERQPPEIPIDSGDPDDDVPTYLTLSRLVGQRDPDRSGGGQRITDWLYRSGSDQRSSSTPEVRLYAEYVDATGHNLPDVTVELFEQPEFQDGRWVELLGYPVSEPFWSYYRRYDSKLPALIQVFERRILVYTPAMEPAKQFTVANTGRHYSQWRYGTDPQSMPSPIPRDAVQPDLTLNEDLTAHVYADDIGTPIDLALSPSGHVLILTQEGVIYRSEGLDPAGPASGFEVWASGIHEPQGLVTRGGSVLVTAGEKVLWYREKDGAGVKDESATDQLTGSNPAIVRGKPVSNSAGQVFARTDINGDGQVLREIGTNEPIVYLDELVEAPGAVAFSGGDLLVSGVSGDGRPTVYLVPSVAATALDNIVVKVATFPQQSTIRSLAIANEQLWTIRTFGDVIIAVHDGDEASIFGVTRGQALDESEVIELAGGFSRPTAMIVGLDGSLYVADADQQRVVRIVHNANGGSGS